MQKLIDSGVIEQFAAQLDRDKLGLSILAFVHVSLVDHRPETLESFNGIVAGAEEILECHALSGQYDYLLKVVAQDMAHFEQFMTRDVLSGRGVNSANTSFVLKQGKSTTALPL